MTPLNPQQKLAVFAPKKPLLIVAGAGTGKTKTLTNRLAYLVDNGVPPSHILALTFTNKAAKEMASRLSAGGAWIGTFHSLGASILRTECREVGRTPSFGIFDDKDSLHLAKKIVKDLDLPKRFQSPASLLGGASQMKNGSARGGTSILPPEDPFSLFYEAYETALRRNNAFDFDDLIEKPVRILKANPEILAKYQNRFAHILIDEYQDLNNMQYEFVKLLATRAETFTVVGDDQQTIYSWRGSNFKIFLDFEKDWPDAVVVLLEENYRSSGNILAAANAVIAQNKNQKTKKLWTRNAVGEPVHLKEALHEDEEAFWIAETIAENPSTETAVLYRTNAQSRAIEQALLARKIPYRIFGGVKFYERKEIRDILAGVRMVANPSDTVSFERLEKALGKRRSATLREALLGKETLPPVELINAFLKSADYFSYLDRNTTNPIERRENIAELIYFASQFESASQFLEQTTLLQATDTVREETTRAVSLMTVHMAKGLEFDRVFIAGCVEGTLPHNRSLGKNEDIEEERRLMYVAMTRARKELYLSFYGIPSRFLSEIPSELLLFETASDDMPQRSFDDEERYITLD